MGIEDTLPSIPDAGKHKGGKFVKGVSGNPAGRPKGTRNRITELKIALEGDLRAQIKPAMTAVLQKCIDMALAGDSAMIKLLIDKTIPTTKATDDGDGPKEKIQIFIDRINRPDEKPFIEGKVVPINSQDE